MGGEGPEQAEVVEVEPKSLDGPDAGERDPGAGPSSGEESGAGTGKTSPEEEESPEGDRPWWKKPRGEGEDPEGAGEPSGTQAQRPEEEPSSAGDVPSQAAAPEPDGPSPTPGPEEGSVAEGDSAEEDAEKTPETDRPSEPAQADDETPTGDGEAEEPQQVAKAQPPFWAVMVGSFQNPDNAEGLRDRLRDEGFPARVRTQEVEGQQWRRVLVGAEDSKDAARELVPRLEQAGYDNTLVLKVE